MRQLLPAVTVTVAATIFGVEDYAASGDVRVHRTALRPALPPALGAQRGTKPPAPAQIVTPAVGLRDERVDSAAIGRTMAYRVLLPEHYANGRTRPATRHPDSRTTS
jgi:hypothetical protein